MGDFEFNIRRWIGPSISAVEIVASYSSCNNSTLDYSSHLFATGSSNVPRRDLFRSRTPLNTIAFSVFAALFMFHLNDVTAFTGHSFWRHAVLQAASLRVRNAKQEAEKLYVMIAADTADEKIGASCRTDMLNWREFFDNSSNIPEDRRVVKSFSPAEGNFTQEAVFTYISDIAAGDKSSILFVFAGHGDYVDDEGQRIMIPTARDKHARVPRAKIVKALSERNPRLLAVISDCCSYRPAGDRLAGAPRKLTPPTHCWDAVRCLFFQASGSVSITACSEGQLSFGHESSGGFFTASLLDTLDRPMERLDNFAGATKNDGFLTWRELFPQVIAPTREKFKQHVGSFDFAGKTHNDQTPQAFRLPHDQKRDLKPKYELGLFVKPNDGSEGFIVRGRGVRVVSVKPSTPAAEHFQTDDIIVSVDGKSVRDLDEFACQIDFSDGNVSIVFARGRKFFRREIQLRERPRSKR